MSGKSERDVKWLDGIRGIASITVVLTHLCRTLDGGVFFPAPDENTFPRIMQFPIIRVLFQGRFGVTVFSILTGYVCALKPIRQGRTGNIDAALSTVAKAAFRRPPRLVLPATVATLIIWVMAECNLFALAERVDAYWLFTSAPQRSGSVGEALSRLWNDGLLATWVRDGYNNYYDINQWTMMPLLRVSMLVFALLFATAYVRPNMRMVICAAMMVFFFLCRDFQFGMQAAYGVLLSDFSNHPTLSTLNFRQRWIRPVLCASLIVFGLFLCSYPEIFPEWTRWSHSLQLVAETLLPPDSDAPRFYTAVGVDLLVLGIQLWPRARDALSHRILLWLGKNSFAVYLLHGPLLRGVLVWMIWGWRVPGYEVEYGEDGLQLPPPRDAPPADGLTLAVALPIWFALVYACAELWTSYVDPWAARVTRWLEAKCFDEGEKSASGILLS